MHKTWRKSHKAPPATPVEEKEYATLMSKIVGAHPPPLFLHRTHSRTYSLVTFVLTGLVKVPPATPVEEKEYATLMSKIVGTHPLTCLLQSVGTHALMIVGTHRLPRLLVTFVLTGLLPAFVLTGLLLY